MQNPLARRNTRNSSEPLEPLYSNPDDLLRNPRKKASVTLPTPLTPEPYPRTPEGRSKVRELPRAPRPPRILPTSSLSILDEETLDSQPSQELLETFARIIERRESTELTSKRDTNRGINDTISESLNTPPFERNPTEPPTLTPAQPITRQKKNKEMTDTMLKLDEEALRQVHGDKLPKVYRKSPPEFNGEDPDSLVPWLDSCERLFAMGGVEADAAKKFLALEWMSYKTRMEWRNNPEVVKNDVTWSKFKEILKKGYPESSSYESGSKNRLIKLVKESKLIRREDEQKLQHYVRRFTLESGKLMKGKRPVLSNNEAVRWFLLALEESFKNLVLDKIEIDDANETESRRSDDLFTLDEVIKSAVRQSQLWKGYHLALDTVEESAPKIKTVKTEPSDEWSRKISYSEDLHDIQLKEQAQKIDSLAKGIAKMQAAFERGVRTTQSAPIPASSSYPSKPGSNGFGQQRALMISDMLCYFCREKGHGARNCPAFLELLDKGILVKKEGTNMHMLKDGGFIPKDDDHTSKKDKVLKIAQEKGWLNDNFGVHFYEDPGDDENNVQFLQETDEPDMVEPDLINLARQLKRAMALGIMDDQSDAQDASEARSKNY